MTEEKDMFIPYWVNGAVRDMGDLKPEDVNLYDVAHTLSQINRFGGRTPFPYSVAQHAVLVSYLTEGGMDHGYEGLHHDDTEAFCSDILGPYKKRMRLETALGWPDGASEPFSAFEARALRLPIATKFKLLPVEPLYVKTADRLAFKLEARFVQARPLADEEWALPAWAKTHERVIVGLLRRMTPENACQAYLMRHNELGGTRESMRPAPEARPSAVPTVRP